MPEDERVDQLNQAIQSMLANATSAAPPSGEPAELIEIAAMLRDLPSQDFKSRLKTELQRRTTMPTATSAAAPSRARFRTITPFLIHSNAPGLVEFLKATFQAEELKRDMGTEAYGFYSEVRIGGTVLVIGGGTTAEWGNLSSVFHVYVEDCDAAYKRALDAGAVPLPSPGGPPADRPYGERSGSVRDAFGNYWYIATRLSSSPETEHWGTVLPYLHPLAARKYIDFLKRAFGAEELAVYENAGRVMHAGVRIGDAVVEMGEPENRAGIPSGGFFLFVEDVETVYQRALATGATAIRPPEDIPYGFRSAIVKDPEGYMWWPARWIEPQPE